jgi:hypothetical protein
VVARLHNERTGYPTQKPEALLERVLLASSDPGSLVADFFCGSGTLPLVAARHGRRFLGADLAWRAIHTTRSRLVAEARYPFGIHLDGDVQVPTFASSAAIHVEAGLIRIAGAPELDYWEVDPAWDGQTFRSAAQARRSNRSAEIPLEIKLPAATKNVCVRAVCTDGTLIQLHV